MNDHLNLLWTAYHSPKGIEIASDDPEFLRQKLYALRKQTAEFECLAFIISPVNPEKLWIVKQGGSDAE